MLSRVTICLCAFLVTTAFQARRDLCAAEAVFAYGVVRTDVGVIFVTHMPNGIDAIDINSGEILWHSDRADRPLLMWKSKLAAFKKTAATTLIIVLLDPRENGAAVFTSDPIILPDWCSITAENGVDFATSAKVADDTLFLQIVAKDSYRGGANPPNQIVAKYSQRKSWVAEVNLSTGDAKLREADEQLKADSKVLSDSVEIGTKRLEILAAKTEKNPAVELVEKKLQALDMQTGEVLWQASVGSVDVPRHPKLPQ